jgi:hypothetical protein
MTVKTSHLLAAMSLLWLLPATTALAQTQSEPVVVTGRTPEQARQFVDRLAIAPSTVDQLARWDNQICTSVVGMPRRQAEFLADHVARRAMGVGLSPGASGCQANVAIFVTADANAMARRLFEEDRSLFAYYPENNVATLGQVALEDFLNTPRPVRWWHVAETFSADGLALSGDASTGGVSNAPVARSSGSRLNEDTRQDFNRVIIIVDAQRVGGVQLATLADYVAMVALAQIDPSADFTGLPTIMRVFAGGSDVTAMTDWDLAFLDGLYHATRDAATARQQEQEIARRMLSGGPSGS